MGRVQVRFKCDECEEEFVSERSDAEAIVIFEETHLKPYEPDKAATVCADCYALMLEEFGHNLKRPVN